jgi:hypothetical protein
MTTPAPGSFSALLARFNPCQRLALAGGALAFIGGLVLIGTDGLNANGTPGPAVVVVLGAAIAVASLVLRRGRKELVTALATGTLLVAIIEAIPPIRYSADLAAFGGILGAVARAVAVAGTMALLVGVAGRNDPRRRIALESTIGRLPMLLILAGTALLVVGWLTLVGVGVGFAPRVIDGLAVVAACLAVATARTRVEDGPAPIRLAFRFGPAFLAAVVAFVTLDSILAIAGRFGDLLGSGPSSAVAYLVYLASAVPFLAAAALVLRPLLRTSGGGRAAPAQESAAS